MFTDLADSTGLKTQLGDRAVGELIGRHRAQATKLAADSGGRSTDWPQIAWMTDFATN